MKKWIVQINFVAAMEVAVEAEDANEAEEKALEIAGDPEEFEIAEVEAFRDWEAEIEAGLDYEMADGYYDDPEEEEEFEPGRPILDQMALNP